MDPSHSRAFYPELGRKCTRFKVLNPYAITIFIVTYT